MERFASLGTSFDVVEGVLVIVGAIYAWRHMCWYATYLLIAFAVAGPAFVMYTNAKISDETTHAVVERFFLLSHTILAPLAGFAVLAAGEAAEGARPDVTTVFLPVVPADWYRELKREHRDLVLTADRYAPGAGEMRSFIDADRKRPIATIGDLPDSSLNGLYWFYGRGIIFEIKPVAETVTLDDMTAENLELIGMYRIPRYDELPRTKSWERLTLVDYGLANFRVGKEYEIGGGLIEGEGAQACRGALRRRT